MVGFFVNLDTAVNCWKKSYPHHQYSSCKAMANINADASTDINWAEIHYLLLLCEHLYSQNYGPIYCNNIYRSVFFFFLSLLHARIHIHFHSFCLISCVCTNIITNTILINWISLIWDMKTNWNNAKGKRLWARHAGCDLINGCNFNFRSLFTTHTYTFLDVDYNCAFIALYFMCNWNSSNQF